MRLKITRTEFPLLVFSILLPQLVGTVGAFFTFSSIASWYMYLEKPGFTPPDWVFGPVWSTLYILMGISLFLVVRHSMNGKNIRAVQIFFLQLFLNLLWSIVFFGSHSIGGGLVVIIVMWFLIVITILKFAKHSGYAALLLLPYLAWVTFATYLNFVIFMLNS